MKIGKNNVDLFPAFLRRGRKRFRDKNKIVNIFRGNGRRSCVVKFYLGRIKNMWLLYFWFVISRQKVNNIVESRQISSEVISVDSF